MKILYDALPNTISNIKFAMLYFDDFDVVVTDFKGFLPFANIEQIADVIRDGRVKVDLISENDIEYETALNQCYFAASLYINKLKQNLAGDLIRDEMEAIAGSYHDSQIFDYYNKYPYLYYEDLHDLLIDLGGGRKDDYDVFTMWQIYCNANLLLTALAYMDCGDDIMIGSNVLNYQINCFMGSGNNTYIDKKEMLNIFLPSFDNLDFDGISFLKEKCCDELIELRHYLNFFLKENSGLNVETKKIKLQKAIDQFERKIKDRKYDIFHNVFCNIGNFTYIPLLATFFTDIPTKISLALSSGFIIENILHEVRKVSKQLKEDSLYFTRGLKNEYNKLK